MKNIVIDIGASSYRIIICEMIENDFKLKEYSRYQTISFMNDNFLRWDIYDIVNKIKKDIKKILQKNNDITSIGVDSFGVDYVYLNDNNELIDLPISYRDNSNDLYANKVLNILNYEEIYKITGIQYLNFNTLFQLYRDKCINRVGSKFLMIADYINYILCGNLSNELTNLSTGSLIDKDNLYISEKLINKLELNKTIFQKIVKPGEVIGYLKKEYFSKNKERNIPVIAVNSHDTASAISALNLDISNSAYLSCGSWALLGVKNKEFFINNDILNGNFTNELMDDGVCFLKNINGMFLINQIFSHLNKIDKNYYIPRSVSNFKEEDETDILIDVNSKDFQNPDDILTKFYNYLIKTNQVVDFKLNRYKVLSILYKSLCLRIRVEFDKLQNILNKRISNLYLVGGASDIPIFNKYLASCLNIKIVSGLKEATTIGNSLIQFSTTQNKNINELRMFLEKLDLFKIYLPDEKEVDKFNNSLKKFKTIMEG